MKKLFIVLLSVLSPQALADEITAPIVNLFDAMREHDGEKLKSQFTAAALLQRAQEDGAIRTSDINKFAAGIAKTKSYLDEHLLAVKVQRSGNLASVWTPYVFYRDEQLSHCGVNSFQLVETPDGWKIHYLIDNSHPGDCETFIARHKQ